MRLSADAVVNTVQEFLKKTGVTWSIIQSVEPDVDRSEWIIRLTSTSYNTPKEIVVNDIDGSVKRFVDAKAPQGTLTYR